MISTQSYQPNAYSSEDQYLLEMLAATAAIAIENSRLLKEIQWLAITDPLTGLYNRRGLFQLAEREVERYRRFGRPFCVYMIDIDRFKQINDTHGHAAGDQVLVGLANRLKQRIRDIDIIGRYGGEEILVVLPETQLAQGLLAAERARNHIQQVPIHTDRGEIPVTISVGVAEIDGKIADLAALVDRADSAMYAAKQAGRNRVTAYRGDTERVF
jgi:diguanylate cyclase (GGDEF)-like protein